MTKFSSLLLAFLLLISPTLASAEQKPVEEFTGEVRKGQDFNHDLKTYKNLTFRVTFDREAGKKPGWTIMVTPKNSPRNDYAAVATAPHHGDNPRFLTTSYGHKPEDVIKNNPRNFNFVTNEDGYRRVFEQVEDLMWPSTSSRTERTIPLGEFPSGSFLITSSGVSETAVEFIKFKVQIFGPANSAPKTPAKPAAKPVKKPAPAKKPVSKTTKGK